jgi:hypothetical protein
MQNISGQIYATFHPDKLGLSLENCIVIRSVIIGNYIAMIMEQFE